MPSLASPPPLLLGGSDTYPISGLNDCCSLLASSSSTLLLHLQLNQHHIQGQDLEDKCTPSLPRFKFLNHLPYHPPRMKSSLKPLAPIGNPDPSHVFSHLFLAAPQPFRLIQALRASQPSPSSHRSLLHCPACQLAWSCYQGLLRCF